MCGDGMDREEDVVANVCESPESPVELAWWVSPKLTKAGFVGSGNIINLVEIIKLIVDIDGRSDASSCAHKNPTWMHLKTCS